MAVAILTNSFPAVLDKLACNSFKRNVILLLNYCEYWMTVSFLMMLLPLSFLLCYPCYETLNLTVRVFLSKEGWEGYINVPSRSRTCALRSSIVCSTVEPSGRKGNLDHTTLPPGLPGAWVRGPGVPWFCPRLFPKT